MVVIAGPPGGGKSTAFPVSGFGLHFFNADDAAATLNGGSYIGISLAVRSEVNRLFEAFILDHISRRESLAFETTLRTAITFDQMKLAKQAGFTTEMRYVALESFEMHARRVKMRAFRGGHSASETLLRGIWQQSMSNLGRAILETDQIEVYDNSLWGVLPTILLEARQGEIIFQNERLPAWLERALPE